MVRKKSFKAYHHLPKYFPDEKLKEAFEKDFDNTSLAEVNSHISSYLKSKQIDGSNIYDVLRTQLQVEDMFDLAQYPQLVQTAASLVQKNRRHFQIKLHLPGINPETIIVPYMDEVVLVPQTDIPVKTRQFRFAIDVLQPHEYETLPPRHTLFRRVARVVEVSGDSVLVRLEHGDTRFNVAEEKFDLIFRPTRTAIRYQFFALEMLASHWSMRQFLCPYVLSEPPATAFSGKMPTITLQLVNQQITSNPEQLQAVRNVVEGTNGSMPYLVFGPPGTGKTSTLVECILQLRLRSPSSRILVAAGSNSACDTIAQRLIHYLHGDSTRERFERLGLVDKGLIRVYAKSVERRGIENLPKDLRDQSNCSSGAHQWPSVHRLQEYGILVATLCTVGKLVNGNIGHVKRSDPHSAPLSCYSYIFVDEAAASTEQETLVALMGIRNSPECRVVFGGDPMQLGPVIKSQRAKELGLAQSMMERLSKLPSYEVDESGNYDQTVLTRLRRNYRSHPEIVSLFNTLFYDGDLVAARKKESLISFANWPVLPDPEFPIIFQAAHGTSAKAVDSFSSYNDLELQVCLWFLQRLLVDGVNGRRLEQHQIGIITPYKLQCNYMQNRLAGRKWSGVEVGSVEAFQGKEKDVIIMSFVKSFAPLGFIKNRRRINVALSRAKSLLIIIGNPVTLRHVPDLNYVINECEQHSSMLRKAKQKRSVNNRLFQITYEGILKEYGLSKEVSSLGPNIFAPKSVEKAFNNEVTVKLSQRNIIKVSYKKCEKDRSKPSFKFGEKDLSKPSLKFGEKDLGDAPFKFGEKDISKVPFQFGEKDLTKPSLKFGEKNICDAPFKFDEKDPFKVSFQFGEKNPVEVPHKLGEKDPVEVQHKLAEKNPVEMPKRNWDYFEVPSQLGENMLFKMPHKLGEKELLKTPYQSKIDICNVQYEQGERDPFEVAYKPIKKDPFEVSYEPIKHDPFEVSYQPVKRDPFEVSYEPIKKDPFEVSYKPVKRDPFEVSFDLSDVDFYKDLPHTLGGNQFYKNLPSTLSEIDLFNGMPTTWLKVMPYGDEPLMDRLTKLFNNLHIS